MKHSLGALATACFSTGTTAMNLKNTRPPLRGVVFDMDGTLTIPNLDFAEMYRRCNVDLSKDILQVLRDPALPPQEAAEKHAIIEEMERHAAATMKLMPGALELKQWLRDHEIPTALVTRNTIESALVLEDRLGKFDIIIARDSHEEVAPKPDPAALHYIADQWKLDPSAIAMVGDSPANDIVFGNRAGSFTCLLNSGRAVFEADKSQEAPHLQVEQLHELPFQLFSKFSIESEMAQPLKKYEVPVPSTTTTKAAFEGMIEKMEAAMLNEPDSTTNTPLVWAADAGHLHVVEYLLQQKVDMDAQGYLGATAVCRAARRGHEGIVDCLAKAGANLDIPNTKRQYPLHFAAFKQNKGAVHTLLKYGANTRVLDRKGRTPSMDTSCQEIRDILNEAFV